MPKYIRHVCKAYHVSSNILVHLPERKMEHSKPETPHETEPLVVLTTISQKLIKVIKNI